MPRVLTGAKNRTCQVNIVRYKQPGEKLIKQPGIGFLQNRFLPPYLGHWGVSLLWGKTKRKKKPIKRTALLPWIPDVILRKQNIVRSKYWHWFVIHGNSPTARKHAERFNAKHLFCYWEDRPLIPWLDVRGVRYWLPPRTRKISKTKTKF